MLLDTRFSFIDLFAGIGGTRQGFEQAGGKCVFTSEWNKWANETYQANFDCNHLLVGDIVPFLAEEVPDHDVLLAGFPCQPFSISGVSKRNSLGRAHGFECTTQGTLFFDVARIIATKKPKAFFLENVKNLLSHDGGNTFKVIIDTLQEELGYNVYYKVINGVNWVPQNRERIFIVGFKDNVDFTWDDLKIPENNLRLKDILHPEDGTELPEEPYTKGLEAQVSSKYVLSDRLMGFPDTFKIPVSDTQTYQQFGNSVVVPLVAAIANMIIPHLITPQIPTFTSPH